MHSTLSTTLNLFRPGQIVEARGRLWRVERAEDKVLQAVPLEQVEAKPSSFYLPLEGDGIRPVAAGTPPELPGDPALHALFLRAYRVSMMHGTAPLVSLQRSRVIPTNYQLVPVMMALDMSRVRLMIADDVGLGKTIEAGLVTVELLARKRIERVLVVTPANLRNQWAEAFQYFFHIPLTVLSSVTQKKLGSRLPPGANPWAYYSFVVTSIDYAKTDAIRNIVLSQKWDMVIVDEAHVAAMPMASMGRGKADKEAYEFVRDLARKVENVVLCTATPHNGHSVSFASLVAMLDELEEAPGQPPRRAFGLVSGSSDEPYVNRDKAARHIVQRRRKDVLEWFESENKSSPFPSRDRENEQFIVPNKTEQGIFQALEQYKKHVFGVKEGDIPPIVRWLIMGLLRRATSSPRALKISMKNRIEKLTKRLNQADEDVGLSGETKRAMRDAVVDLGDGELFSEAELEEELISLSILDQVNLQAEIGYLEAVQNVLKYWQPSRDSKLSRLIELLTSPLQLGKYGRTIVFTRYTDTMSYLADELAKALEGFDIFWIHGQLPEAAKQERLRDFQASKRGVLVATDALSEGLNLQFAANQLVHYDLPWNPNRLEQRNGRIDRFKQPEDEVRVRTLIMQESFDLVVFERLIAKAQRIKEAFGFVPAYFSNAVYLEQALSQDLLGQRFGQGSLFEATPLPAEVEEIDEAQLTRIQQESFYGQAAFRLPDVETRLAETQRTVGSQEELERLFVEALRFFQWEVQLSAPRHYLVRRAGGLAVPSVSGELEFTFDTNLGGSQPELTTLDLAHPFVAEVLNLIRRQAYRDLEGARTAVLARVFPEGVATVAHATFHIRARFSVGTNDTTIIEALIPLTVNLGEGTVADVYEILWAAPNAPVALAAASLAQLTKHALNLPSLDTLVSERIQREADTVTAERKALKASLLDVYPDEAAWLDGIDQVTPAAHDLIALTVFVPAQP